ncbi:MAG: hypothetical protein Q9183_001701 [Haloplaca sp. 2 TL-2023]
MPPSTSQAGPSASGKSVKEKQSCSDDIKQSCEVSIEYRCSPVVANDMDSGVDVSREVSLTTCTCDDKICHKHQLHALKLFHTTYSRLDERYHMIGVAYKKAVTMSQDVVGVVNEIITQLLGEDLDYLTSASNALTRSAIRRGYKHGVEKSKLPKKKATVVDFVESHQSRYLRAKAALEKRVEAFRKDVEASLSTIQATTPQGRFPDPVHYCWKRKLSEFISNPYIPRYADAPAQVPNASSQPPVEKVRLPATAAAEQKEPAPAPDTPDLGSLPLDQLPIVKSNLKPMRLAPGASWDCTRVMVRLSPTAQESEICLDSGAARSIASSNWGFTSNLTTGVQAFVRIPLYFAGTRDGTGVLAQLSHHLIAIIDDVPANMLIGNDIIGSEEIVIDVSKKRAFIGSCKVTIKATCSRLPQPVEQPSANEPITKKLVHGAKPVKKDSKLTSKATVEQEVSRALSALRSRGKQFKEQDMECQRILRKLELHQKLLTGCQQFFRSESGKDRIRRFYQDILVNTTALPMMPGRAAVPDKKAESRDFVDCKLAEEAERLVLGSTHRCAAPTEVLAETRGLRNQFREMVSRHQRDDAELMAVEAAKRDK